jgi:hypothetical protein
MNIKGLNKALLLAALYNNKSPLGMGWLQFKPGNMSPAEATKELLRSTSFDYLYGRPMKIDLSGDELDLTLYNRDDETCLFPGETIVEAVRKATS